MLVYIYCTGIGLAYRLPTHRQNVYTIVEIYAYRIFAQSTPSTVVALRARGRGASHARTRYAHTEHERIHAVGHFRQGFPRSGEAHAVGVFVWMCVWRVSMRASRCAGSTMDGWLDGWLAGWMDARAQQISRSSDRAGDLEWWRAGAGGDARDARGCGGAWRVYFDVFVIVVRGRVVVVVVVVVAR